MMKYLLSDYLKWKKKNNVSEYCLLYPFIVILILQINHIRISIKQRLIKYLVLN